MIVNVRKQLCEIVEVDSGEKYYRFSRDMWLVETFNDINEVDLEVSYQEFANNLKDRIATASTEEINQMLVNFRDGIPL